MSKRADLCRKKSCKHSLTYALCAGQIIQGKTVRTPLDRNQQISVMNVCNQVSIADVLILYLEVRVPKD